MDRFSEDFDSAPTTTLSKGRRLRLGAAGVTAVAMIGFATAVTLGGADKTLALSTAPIAADKPAPSYTIVEALPTTTAAPAVVKTVAPPAAVAKAKATTTTTTTTTAAPMHEEHEEHADILCELGYDYELPTKMTRTELYGLAATARTAEDGDYFRELGIVLAGSSLPGENSSGELRFMDDVVENKRVVVYMTENLTVGDVLVVDNDKSQEWTSGVYAVPGSLAYKGGSDPLVFMLAEWDNGQRVSIDKAWRADQSTGKIVQVDLKDITEVPAAE